MTVPGTANHPASRFSPAPEVQLDARGWTWAALAVALSALAGSLFLSLGLGLKACPLCLYQRTFVMGVVAVLGVGLLTPAGRSGFLSLLALPLALGGLGVAAFHEFLEQTGKLECPPGILGWATAPQQALALLVVLALLLIVPVARHRRGGEYGWPLVSGAVLLGLGFAVSAVASAPPMPAPPAKPYEQPLDICRPPFSSP